jgi:hypothetical protein
MRLIQRWANASWWVDVVVTAPAVGVFVVLGEMAVCWALG